MKNTILIMDLETHELIQKYELVDEEQVFVYVDKDGDAKVIKVHVED